MAYRHTPRGNSLQIASLIMLIYILGILAMNWLDVLNNLYWQIGFGIFLFVVAYLIIYRGFLNYVKDSITPIYTAIGKVVHNRRQLRSRLQTGKLTDELNKEVKIWADDQSNEIRQLREMEEYRKDFLGNVSHELKTPIFNIQGYILTLLDGGIDDKKVNKLYLQRTEKSINRMISIVDDLVSISRLESGEFKLQIEKFNIVRLVEDIFESHEMLTRKFKVKLEFDKNYNKAIRVNADRRRITEALSNLIVNSMKYGKLNGKTKVGFSITDDVVMVEISDNGIGISEEHLPRIFERFYRVDKSRSRDTGGTGLGLSIVKHVILAHNQSINVRSVVNKGTSFEFSLEKA
jgi:two-component system phosphate regulon sensor histidine kinase PhoR